MKKNKTKIWFLVSLIGLMAVGAITSYTAKKGGYYKGIEKAGSASILTIEEAAPEPVDYSKIKKENAVRQKKAAKKLGVSEMPESSKSDSKPTPYQKAQTKPQKPAIQPVPAPCEPDRIPVIRDSRITGCAKN